MKCDIDFRTSLQTMTWRYGQKYNKEEQWPRSLYNDESKYAKSYNTCYISNSKLYLVIPDNTNASQASSNWENIKSQNWDFFNFGPLNIFWKDPFYSIFIFTLSNHQSLERCTIIQIYSCGHEVQSCRRYVTKTKRRNWQREEQTFRIAKWCRR